MVHRGAPVRGRRGGDAGSRRSLAEGRREFLLTAIEARGFTLGDAQRSTIAACNDRAQLDHWLRRLFQVDSAEALFTD